MIRFIEPDEDYLIVKVILMVITGTCFVNGESSAAELVCEPKFIAAIGYIPGRPLNPPLKKA